MARPIYVRFRNLLDLNQGVHTSILFMVHLLVCKQNQVNDISNVSFQMLSAAMVVRVQKSKLSAKGT